MSEGNSTKVNNKKITVLYCRTSTLMQEKGLDAQARALRRYCSEKGITDYVIYEDDGISGTKDSRPALNKMMAEVNEGKVERVIVYSFSRYARSTSHLLKALEIFKRLNVAFVSITENIDTNTPLGVAVFSIISALAQLERDLISERVKNGLRAAKERGVHIGRKKIRPSQLIRTLRKSGLTYRKIAEIAKISQGCVGAEMRAWNKEIKDGNELVFGPDIPPLIEAPTPKVADELPAPLVEPVNIIRY
jgi:DNA invertase Pin-like site-specific DNA recombinase